MSLQLHSLLIACGGFTPIMHTYLLSPISPPSTFFFFFLIHLSTRALGLAKRLCTCGSSPWNQGHLRGRSMFFCSDELPPPPPPHFTVFLIRFSPAALISSLSPVIGHDVRLTVRRVIRRGWRGKSAEGCGEPSPSRRAPV